MWFAWGIVGNLLFLQWNSKIIVSFGFVLKKRSRIGFFCIRNRGQCTQKRDRQANLMRFIGDYPAKTDAKGRVFLPAAFRKLLEKENEQRLILRIDLFQRCLVLYPESLWNRMLDELSAKLNRWNGQHQSVMRRFVAEAEVVELDGNGRFLINKRKLQYAGIKQDVRFLAVDDHIEVWNKEACEALLAESDSLGADLQALMGNMDTGSGICAE